MKDAIFITYPDSFVRGDEKPLKTLSRLDLECFDAVHVLPFFPSTSDKGFSVSDYTIVDPEYGDWNDLPDSLMVDCVFNHTSRSHPWFDSHPEYYLRFDSVPKTSVFRPRDSSLFTQIGEYYYWTTFSADQIDLDVSKPEVQEELENIISLYIDKGAKLLRIDAAPYLFKDFSHISTIETHEYLQSLIKKFSDVTIIAEVNRVQEEIDEYRKYAHVYNFALPGLVYHAFLHQDISGLLTHLQDDFRNYINVLATHDGIGLNAARSYVDTSSLVDDTRAKGFSGSEYELNINYFDALDRSEDKMITAHSLLLCLEGIPAVYYHSFFGSYGIKVAGRGANRAVIHYDSLMQSLSTNSVTSRINSSIRHLLGLREKLSESQEVYEQDGLLVVKRGDVLCLHNFSAQQKRIAEVYDLVSEQTTSCVKAFGCVWHKKDL